MNKNEIILLVRNAKAGHKKWVENAISLIEGLPLDKTQVPVNATECMFGQWYYGEGQGLKSVAAFKEIEKYHDGLHRVYRDIFILLFDESKPSLLDRLFGISRRVSEEKRLAADEKLQTLKLQSRSIMKKLDELEEIIFAMSPEKLDGFLHK
jgi:chaperonin cofactor prefoldin